MNDKQLYVRLEHFIEAMKIKFKKNHQKTPNLKYLFEALPSKNVSFAIILCPSSV